MSILRLAHAEGRLSERRVTKGRKLKCPTGCDENRSREATWRGLAFDNGCGAACAKCGWHGGFTAYVEARGLKADDPLVLEALGRDHATEAVPTPPRAPRARFSVPKVAAAFRARPGAWRGFVERWAVDVRGWHPDLARALPWAHLAAVTADEIPGTAPIRQKAEDLGRHLVLWTYTPAGVEHSASLRWHLPGRPPADGPLGDAKAISLAVELVGESGGVTTFGRLDTWSEAWRSRDPVYVVEGAPDYLVAAAALGGRVIGAKDASGVLAVARWAAEWARAGAREGSLAPVIIVPHVGDKPTAEHPEGVGLSMARQAFRLLQGITRAELRQLPGEKADVADLAAAHRYTPAELRAALEALPTLEVVEAPIPLKDAPAALERVLHEALRWAGLDDCEAADLEDEAGPPRRRVAVLHVPPSVGKTTISRTWGEAAVKARGDLAVVYSAPTHELGRREFPDAAALEGRGTACKRLVEIEDPAARKRLADGHVAWPGLACGACPYSSGDKGDGSCDSDRRRPVGPGLYRTVHALDPYLELAPGTRGVLLRDEKPAMMATREIRIPAAGRSELDTLGPDEARDRVLARLAGAGDSRLDPLARWRAERGASGALAAAAADLVRGLVADHRADGLAQPQVFHGRALAELVERLPAAQRANARTDPPGTVAPSGSHLVRGDVPGHFPRPWTLRLVRDLAAGELNGWTLQVSDHEAVFLLDAPPPPPPPGWVDLNLDGTADLAHEDYEALARAWGADLRVFRVGVLPEGSTAAYHLSTAGVAVSRLGRWKGGAWTWRAGAGVHLRRIFVEIDQRARDLATVRPPDPAGEWRPSVGVIAKKVLADLVRLALDLPADSPTFTLESLPADVAAFVADLKRLAVGWGPVTVGHYGRDEVGSNEFQAVDVHVVFEKNPDPNEIARERGVHGHRVAVNRQAEQEVQAIHRGRFLRRAGGRRAPILVRVGKDLPVAVRESLARTIWHERDLGTHDRAPTVDGSRALVEYAARLEAALERTGEISRSEALEWARAAGSDDQGRPLVSERGALRLVAEIAKRRGLEQTSGAAGPSGGRPRMIWRLPETPAGGSISEKPSNGAVLRAVPHEIDPPSVLSSDSAQNRMDPRFQRDRSRDVIVTLERNAAHAVEDRANAARNLETLAALEAAVRYELDPTGLEALETDGLAVCHGRRNSGGSWSLTRHGQRTLAELQARRPALEADARLRPATVRVHVPNVPPGPAGDRHAVTVAEMAAMLWLPPPPPGAFTWTAHVHTHA